MRREMLFFYLHSFCVSACRSAMSPLRDARRFLCVKRKSRRSKASSGPNISASRPGTSRLTMPCWSIETVKALLDRTCRGHSVEHVCTRCAGILGIVGSSSPVFGDDDGGWMVGS